MSNANVFHPTQDRFRVGLGELTGKWGWCLGAGVFLIILGFIACIMSITTTMLSTLVVGWILLAAGAGLAVLSFLTGKWSGFLLTMAAGILSIVAGIEFVSYPLSGPSGINMIIGTMLLVAGTFRLLSSIVMRFPNWGWALISGIVAFALGIFLLRNWQRTSLSFLAVVVGIDLIFHGISWITFSLGIHRMAESPGITESDRRVA
jgi:uncharacterized membrane protein HdeD (DUF308 family)